MCREARELAKVPAEEAVNFREMASPAQWNTKGIAGTVKFYRMLRAQQQANFCANFAHILGI